MISTLNEFDQEPRLRPTLLTVLCILTFIGSSWSICTSIYGYATAGVTVKAFSSVQIKVHDSTMQNDTGRAQDRERRMMFRNKMMTSLQTMMTRENIRKSSIGSILSGLFTLAGALIMWRLRRSGFYFYIFGIVIGLIVPFYLYGNNLIAVGLSSVTTFFGLVFIALYALNLKSMR